MLILALDTSSAAGSAAVVRGSTVLVERAGDGSRTHGERLPRELMAVLDEAAVDLRAIDCFAVSIGPGSFTGLRVGIATIQGLALAQGKLVAPVSSFDAIRASGDLRTPNELPTQNLEPRTSATAVWIDAHRGEVFAALYAADGTALAPPTSLTPAATLDAWSALLDHQARVRFGGDGAVRYREAIARRLGLRAAIDGSAAPLAGTIGLIASAHDERAGHPHAIVPLYVRRPDAVLARERRDGAPGSTES